MSEQQQLRSRETPRLSLGPILQTKGFVSSVKKNHIPPLCCSSQLVKRLIKTNLRNTRSKIFRGISETTNKNHLSARFLFAFHEPLMHGARNQPLNASATWIEDNKADKYENECAYNGKYAERLCKEFINEGMQSRRPRICSRVQHPSVDQAKAGFS